MEHVDWIYLAHYRDKLRAVVKNGNEFSGPIKCGDFLDQLRNYRFLKKDSVP
jgi:hypothetical protein